MDLRSGKTVRMADSSVETGFSVDRIAVWRNLAQTLGVPAEQIPTFVADRMEKEREREERMKSEAERAQKKLELEAERAQKEVDERLKMEAAERQKKLELEAERLKMEAERLKADTLLAERAFQEKLKFDATEREERLEMEAAERAEKAEREKAEHELRLELLRLETQKAAESTATPRATSDQDRGDVVHLSLPAFDEDRDDIVTWLTKFERVATLYKWKRETWATRVSTRLTGRAAEVYNHLRDDEAENYDTLKDALLARYQLNADTYRRRFRECRKKDNETYRQFGSRLEENLEKWLELSKVGELKQLFLLEQFFRTLSPEMTAFIKERETVSLDQATRTADVYAEAHHDSFKRRNHDRQEGKGPKSNPPPKHVEENKSSGEKSERKFNKALVRCFICQKTGHKARECRSKGPSSGAVVMNKVVKPERSIRVPTLCLSCGQQEYNPYCQVTMDGVTVSGLRDTGSQVCVVKRSLVSDSQFTGQETEVSMAESSLKQRFPLVRVNIDSPFVSGEVEALAMESPACDFIIGNHAHLNDQKVLPVYGQRTVVSVLTRSQTKNEGRPQSKLKVIVPGLEHVRPDVLRQLQEEDPTLQKCREAASKQVSEKVGKSGSVSYKWKNNILHRTYTKDGRSYTQVVVPKSLRQGVIQLAHDSPMSGHQGVRGTRERVWTQFYWPGLCAEIRRYVLSCDRCQKVSRKPLRVPMVPMPTIETPFQRVGVDIIGPILPVSEKGNRYILTMVDFATRYPEAVALKNIDAPRVAEALWEMWSRVGIPAEMLTDRGTQFTSGVMREVERLLAIKGLKTTPYHAQCNGLVERYNGTLKNMLKKLTQEQPKQWDRYIPALCFAYREVPQESLGFSPFELLYGRRVRGPMSVLRQLWTGELPEGELQTTAEYVVDLRNRIAETCQIAHDCLEKSSQRSATHFNKKAAERTFQPGEKVLLLLPLKSNKLEVSWQGPFEVVKRKGEADYVIRCLGRERLYHANLLKKYVERPVDKEDDVPTVAMVVVEETDPLPPLEHPLPLPTLQAKETVEEIHFGPKLTKKQRTEALTLVRKHRKILSDVPLRTNLMEFEMNVESAKPVRVKQYQLPHAKLETVKSEVETMKKLGVIEPAASPYNAPVVLVNKKEGDVRFCVDYRRLNDVTVFDAEPLPDTEYLFSTLKEAKYFTKIDLSKGFWQIPIKKELRHLTAFTTPSGQYQFTVMPFGLKTAVASFSRMMRALLEPLKCKDIHNFMDDILVASKTWAEHMTALKLILQRLEEANLSAKPSKCFLGYNELPFLGHIVREGEILPDVSKTAEIEEAATPTTKKEVRAFLGMVGYYRKFIPKFSTIALPLTDLTKKDAPNKVVWTANCELAFTALKKCLATSPVLSMPDLSAPFVLRTDASDRGLGAVLLQLKGEILHPVAYASRKLSDTETRYSTIEKECLAIVWAVQKFQPFLYGRTFVLETDHQPLNYLQTAKVANSRLMRWSLLLQVYSFVVRVIPGSQNVGADYLSRISSESL